MHKAQVSTRGHYVQYLGSIGSGCRLNCSAQLLPAAHAKMHRVPTTERASRVFLSHCNWPANFLSFLPPYHQITQNVSPCTPSLHLVSSLSQSRMMNILFYNPTNINRKSRLRHPSGKCHLRSLNFIFSSFVGGCAPLARANATLP